MTNVRCPLFFHKGKLVLVTKESDITNNLKAGQLYKFVVTESGKLVILDPTIEHHFGPAMESGTYDPKNSSKIGAKVQAAGYLRYYPGQGVLFDLNTGHYGIYNKGTRNVSEAEATKAKEQVQKAIGTITHDVNDPGKTIVQKGETAIKVRWESGQIITDFGDDSPTRKKKDQNEVSYGTFPPGCCSFLYAGPYCMCCMPWG